MMTPIYHSLVYVVGALQYLDSAKYLSHSFIVEIFPCWVLAVYVRSSLWQAFATESAACMMRTFLGVKTAFYKFVYSFASLDNAILSVPPRCVMREIRCRGSR